MRLTGVAFTGVNDLKVRTVRIDSFAAIKSAIIPRVHGREPFGLTIDRITLGAASAENGKYFHVTTATIEHASAAIVREHDGSLVFPRLPPMSNVPPKAGTSPAPPHVFTIDSVLLDGKSDLLFVDRSVFPEARITLSAIRASLIGFSAPRLSGPSVVALQGGFGPYAPLRANGLITGIDSGGSGTVSAQLEGFNLPLLTGYLHKYLWLPAENRQFIDAT